MGVVRLQDDLRQHLGDPECRSEYGAMWLKMELAILLTDARKSKNLSQQDLARKIGKSQAYIAKLERGDANPTIGQIGSILAAMWMTAQMTPAPLMENVPYGQGDIAELPKEATGVV